MVEVLVDWFGLATHDKFIIFYWQSTNIIAVTVRWKQQEKGKEKEGQSL